MDLLKPENRVLNRITAHQIIPENIFLQGVTPHNFNLKQVEVSLTDSCNQNCSWCFTAGDRVIGRSMNLGLLRKYLDEFLKLGGVSIVFSGGGEPLLYKNLYTKCNEFDDKSILQFCIDSGLAVGLITNGINLSLVLKSIDILQLAFIRVSVDSLNKDEYINLHGCNGKHYNKLIDNLNCVSEEKGENFLPAFGISFIVDKEKHINTERLTLEIIQNYTYDKNIDFVQFKHIHTLDVDQAEETMALVHKILCSMNWRKTEFWVQKYKAPKPHKECHVTNLIQSIGNENNIFPCCHLFGNKKYFNQEIFSPSGIIINDCPSKVCRYVSINDLISNIKNKQQYENHMIKLNNSILEYGYHPYRLFPTAPGLYFPVLSPKTDSQVK